MPNAKAAAGVNTTPWLGIVSLVLFLGAPLLVGGVVLYFQIWPSPPSSGFIINISSSIICITLAILVALGLHFLGFCLGFVQLLAKPNGPGMVGAVGNGGVLCLAVAVVLWLIGLF